MPKRTQTNAAAAAQRHQASPWLFLLLSPEHETAHCADVSTTITWLSPAPARKPDGEGLHRWCACGCWSICCVFVMVWG